MQSRVAPQSPFHAGEQLVQERLGVRDEIEPWARQVVRQELPAQHRAFYAELPFLVVAARDERARPWVTIVAGQPGFAFSPEPGRLQVGSLPGEGDALERTLTRSSDVGVLGIDLANRRRNRANGRVLASTPDGFTLEIEQNFGNCPQYITERDWEPNPQTSSARSYEVKDRLTESHIRKIQTADTLFIGTGYRAANQVSETFGMDASHRGGAPGFVEVQDDNTLIIPDYSGNNHYNTIGNLVMDPRAGLVFPDFATGGMLQLTGLAEIDWNSSELSRFAGARRLIRFSIEEVRSIDVALPIRWKSSSEALRELRVVDKVRESDDVTSFILAPVDGKPIAEFLPGQHLPIELEIPGQTDPVRRTYSISNGVGSGHYRISVKREPKGVASRFLHDVVKPGATLAARSPAGDFVLEDDTKPVVLLSAGVGATPMVSMLHALTSKQTSREIFFVHGARDGRHHPFASEVARVSLGHPNVKDHALYSRPRAEDRIGIDYETRGRMDGKTLRALLPGFDADYYLCGPLAFMSEIARELRRCGVAEASIHTESFGPVG